MPDNILFLMTDQHSVPTIGAYGNQVVQTPRWTGWRPPARDSPKPARWTRQAGSWG